jgi:hypothetical protein
MSSLNTFDLNEILLIGLIIIGYLLIKYIYNKINNCLGRNEGFVDGTILDRQDSSTGGEQVLSINGKIKKKDKFPETIVEKRVNTLFEKSVRMKCNMVPTNSNIECEVGGESFVRYIFPIHMLSMPDKSILAVFNDGRLYSKNSLLSNQWKGPLKNSIPFDSVPLRMISINYKDNSLLGIGFDNKLYAKQADNTGSINVQGIWTLVPNNENIIYCITDKTTKKMVAIDVVGKLLIKKTTSLTSDYEVVGELNVPILKMFYDSNGYMLALDTNFNLVQFKEKNWKASQLNYERGVNKMKVFDILYDQDGKLFGLVFVPGVGLLELMKQQEVYFMSDFVPLEFHTKHSLEGGDNFLLNVIKIIELKTGVNLIEDNDSFGSSQDKDEDLTYAYMKSIVQNKVKMREFCKDRGIGHAYKFENYDMLNNIQNQANQIFELKDVIRTILKYDPDKHKIQDELLLLGSEEVGAK